MKRENLDVILNNVAELKSLFLLGQRTIPFLEEVFTFVQEMIPLMDELKSSVELSSDKLPIASRQLDKVTHATEMASTEILDIVESIAAKIDRIRADVGHAKEVADHAERIVDAGEVLVRSMEQGGKTAEHVRTLSAMVQEHRDLVQRSLPSDQVTEVLTSIQSDCTNIMMALQVQDITSQQIAAVNRIMQSIDEGFDRLMNQFHGRDDVRTKAGYDHPHLRVAFDQSAEYGGGEERQENVDSIVGALRNVDASK